MKMVLLAVALLAYVAVPAALAQDDRFHAAVTRETECFTKAYRPGVDSSRDGGKSALRLLGECGREWDAASAICQSNSQGADKVGSCNLATSLILFIQEGRPLPPDLRGVFNNLSAR
jgi:hypothetical protein